MRNKLRHMILSPIGIGTALVSLILLIFLAGSNAGLQRGDLGSWIGGVGTIGTLGFAIYIAEAGERRRRDEQMDLARIIAAEFWLVLPRVQFDVNTVESWLLGSLERVDSGILQSCADLLAAIPRWDTTKLATLVPLPNHAAAKLSMASTEIQMCADDIRLLSSSITQLPGTNRSNEIHGLLHDIGCIQGYLRDAYTACDSALVTRVV